VSPARNALITGAHGGIGQALCAAFSAAGWNVIGSDLQAASPASCACYVAADLSRLSHDAAYREDCLKRMRACLPDPGTLGALINNAALQVLGPIERLTADDWLTTCAINVIAPFLLVQGLLPQLEAANGAVVNIGSIHARQTKSHFSAYAASKAALEGLTRSLAVELGGRVRVNAVCPAAVATPMLAAGFSTNPDGLTRLAAYHPSGCIGTPEEVAAVVLMLVSNPSHYMTGTIINLDGGISSRLFDPE
jgi:NAD(P)-dependent dehydrogenase (short-subunit alcohol dehydrogenase family)